MIKKDVKDDKVKGQPFRYASYFFDEELEQYYLMARYYHPKQGVFLSVDPEISGDESVTMNNGYAYANNNPIKNIDADGKWFWTAAGGAWGAYDGHRWAKKRGYTGWRYYGSVAAGAAWGATGGKYIGKAVKWGYKAAQTYRFKRNYNRMSILTSTLIKDIKPLIGIQKLEVIIKVMYLLKIMKENCQEEEIIENMMHVIQPKEIEEEKDL